jgi:hypothetical protein
MTGISAFDLKLLSQFPTTTLTRLERTRGSDGRAVLEVRIPQPWQCDFV